MARKDESGIKYFPMNTDIISHTKLKLIISEFGSKSWGVVIPLLCKIYREKGYYIDWNDDDMKLLFAQDECKCDLSFVKEVVTRCIKRGFFDETVFNMFGILTSDRIQENYLEAKKRSKGVEFFKEFCLLNENVYTNVEFVYKTSENVYTSTQIKLKESKVEEIKRNEINTSKEVLPTSSPGTKLPTILKNDLKGEWKQVSEEINKSVDVLSQKVILQKFIVLKKPNFIEPYATAWNLMASENGFATLRDNGLSDKRKDKLKARLKELSFDFMRIMWSIPRNPKYKGSLGENDWKVDFDYVIANDNNYLKIIEGVPNRDAYDIMIHKMLG